MRLPAPARKTPDALAPAPALTLPLTLTPCPELTRSRASASASVGLSEDVTINKFFDDPMLLELARQDAESYF